jgi:hypothetical protein
MSPKSRKWVEVTGYAHGWFFEDTLSAWPNEDFADSLLALYKADEYHPFESALQVHKGARKRESVDYCDEPWLILTPVRESIAKIDAVDVSVGMDYEAHDGAGVLLGTLSLCWEGLSQAFGEMETGTLYVYPARYASVPSVTVAIEEDYS